MSEWKDVGQVLLGSWPSQVAGWGREAIAAYLAELKDRGLSPDEAIKALRVCEGAFPPSAGEAAKRGRLDPERPTFDEAYPTIYRAAAKQQLPEAHPLVVSFIERQGIGRLGSLQLDHPDHGELVRKELRRAFDEHVQTWDGREVARIASGGEPRRLSPAESLQIGAGR